MYVEVRLLRDPTKLKKLHWNTYLGDILGLPFKSLVASYNIVFPKLVFKALEPLELAD